VENKEVDGNFYYLRYPIVRDGGKVASVEWSELRTRGFPAELIPGDVRDTDQAFLTVATTRPETYLGDTAVAVNPRDPRAKALEGLSVRLPIVGRVIPIVADDYVVMPASISGSSDDPKAAFATGFLKVTPAHDTNDWEIGVRHGLQVINVMAPDASISRDHGWTDELGEAGVFVGLSREDARREVVKAFKAARVPGTDLPLMEKVTPYRHSVGHSYRSHVPIEPYLSDQWYVRVTDERLVGWAQRAVGRGEESDSRSFSSSSSFSPGRTGFQPVSADHLTIHHRHLPHWQIGGKTYFITFRTDAGILKDAERRIVLDACTHWHGDRADVRMVTVMPDHVHLLVTPREKSPGEWWPLPELMHSIKSFSAKEINRSRGDTGVVWQREYFDRIVRDENEFFEKCRYMLNNPVKAGLVRHWEEYAFVWRGDRLEAGPTAGKEGSQEPSGDGALRIFPERYEKTYTTWHDNLRDWCISRQLWWGHRIPVWRGSTIATWADHEGNPEEILRTWEQSGRISQHVPHRGASRGMLSADEKESGDWFVCVRDASDTEVIGFLEANQFTQDPDVLDTWFSSGLWPLSTMGWPDAAQAAKDEPKNADFPGLLAAFNPTNVLCTAREIITLWVSRMVMFNRYFLSPDGNATPGPVPYRDVFIHAMIQDGEGRKMSKSLGNGVDPLDIIHSHGTDAMRFVLCQMTTQTQDVRMPVAPDPATGRNTSPKFDIGRNFCTKLWNAARYALSNLESCPPPSGQPITRADLALADRWMLSRLEATVRAAEDALRDYQFSAYATALYDLLWRDYCDWYLEAVKPTLKSNPAQQAVVRTVLDAILRLLHPIAPFITECLFEAVDAAPVRPIAGVSLAKGATTLCCSAWPIVDASVRDEASEREFARAQALVEAIRQARTGAGMKSSERPTLHATASVAAIIGVAGGVVEAVAGLAAVSSAGAPPQSVEVRFEGESVFLAGVVVAVDPGAERAGFESAAAKLAKEIDIIEKRLNNPGYMQKAPAHLVEETRGQLAAKIAEREELLRRLETSR
jgi:valyl-tRNA synthetase